MNEDGNKVKESTPMPDTKTLSISAINVDIQMNGNTLEKMKDYSQTNKRP